MKADIWPAVDARLKSFAHMAVAAYVGCSWCLDIGYFTALNHDLDPAVASQVPHWRESDAFSPLERDVMEYAEAMSSTPLTVTDELSARLLAALGEAGLIELTAYIAFSNFSTRNNVALGIESQGFSRELRDPAGHRPLGSEPADIERREALRVGEDVDLDDPPAADRERADRERLARRAARPCRPRR